MTITFGDQEIIIDFIGNTVCRKIGNRFRIAAVDDAYSFLSQKMVEGWSLVKP